MRKTLSLILLLALLLCCAPYAAADELLSSLDPSPEYPANSEWSFEPEERIYYCGNYKYTLLEDGTAEILSYWVDYYWADDDSSKELVIPEELDGHTVTSIGNGAMGDNGFTRVVIPDTVTRIGDSAFSFCQYLESVVIPDSVTEIGQKAFIYCFALADLTIPDSVTKIGDKAFMGCHALTSVTIPDSVTELGENPFDYCMSLTSIEVSPDHPALEVVDGVLFGRADRRLITYLFTKEDTDYEIPEGVEIIGAWAFADNYSLRSVVIPESVTELRECAFGGCDSLISITIPGSVKVIDKDAFLLCKNLESVTIADGVEAIGEHAFSQCFSLESVAMPNSVASFGDSVFSDCESLASIAIPDSLTEIGRNPFIGCDCLISIEVSQDHPLLELIDGVLFDKTTGYLVCYPCAREGDVYAIPEGTTGVAEYAFYICPSLTNVVIPDSVTEIGACAFYYDSALESVNIPAGVKRIGESVFSFCQNLTLTVARDSYAERYCAWNRLSYTYAEG